MSEENILSKIENCYNIFKGDNPESNLIQLCILIFDYVGFNLLSEHGYYIITMDVGEQQKNILTESDPIEKSRAIFRYVLFLTINYHLFTNFCGLLGTADIVPEKDLIKTFNPDDPKKKIVDKVKLLYELKNHTNIDFPILNEYVFSKIDIVKKSLKYFLDLFDDESAILYNQEKRRIFKPAVFGVLTLDLPEDDELKEMIRKSNIVINAEDEI